MKPPATPRGRVDPPRPHDDFERRQSSKYYFVFSRKIMVGHMKAGIEAKAAERNHGVKHPGFYPEAVGAWIRSRFFER